jgi:hypothetical protein
MAFMSGSCDSQPGFLYLARGFARFLPSPSI